MIARRKIVVSQYGFLSARNLRELHALRPAVDIEKVIAAFAVAEHYAGIAVRLSARVHRERAARKRFVEERKRFVLFRLHCGRGAVYAARNRPHNAVRRRGDFAV